MFGRRYYDPNEDGDTSDALLPVDSGVIEHQALLEHVRPLLENSHLTVANLESPLSFDPYYDVNQPRPAEFHPTRLFAYASHPSAALALRQAGVDLLDLGNSHIYDLRDQGVSDTLDALVEAGFEPGKGYFGAGLSEHEAWAPAAVTIRGQRVAFIGCTSVTGSWYDINFVASDVENKGGAARCSEHILRQKVSQAASVYDIVVVMIHGGWEYERRPSEYVRRMVQAARESGATLVINHSPHVVGGFDWDGSSLVAWSLGNFVFDQTIWSTFETYLLAVHIRHGEVIHAYAEPLMIEDFVPKGLVGDEADFVARGAVGRSFGPFLMENGAMESDFGSLSKQQDTSMPVRGDTETGETIQLPQECWISDFTGEGTIRLGRDLLWVGSFEDEDVDTDRLEGALWDLSGADKYIGQDFAYEGNGGARIERGALNQNDVVLTTQHRIPIEPSTEISVQGMIRAPHDAEVKIQLSWYTDMRGPSSQITVEPIPLVVNNNIWQPFLIDTVAPSDAVSVGLFLRLSPHDRIGRINADFDNIRLITWAHPEAAFSPLYDHVRIKGTGEVTLSKTILPGATTFSEQ
jgi:poly-gamma-glutamate synthesis protein (capsule biosynthesis protein)